MTLNHLFRLALLAGLATAGAHGAALTGPTSSQSPYLVPTATNITTISLLTVGDFVNLKPDGTNAYPMVGIPDGLGAFDNEDGTFTVLMNHELTPNVGIPRAHGFKGAFVSRWIIDKTTLAVLHGEDLMQQAFVWTTNNTYELTTKPFSRFCSGDLPPLSAFYENRKYGYRGRIYMNGEETGAEGRAFAHLLDGRSFELPALGKFSWENSVANPKKGRKTVVIGTDDGTGGQVYIYVGDKTGSTNPITAAGLDNGVLYGIKVKNVTAEDPTNGIKSGTSFTAASLGYVGGMTGAQLETNSVALGITSFQRPEDGCWDPEDPRDFYFVTTASFTGNSRLWRLRFVNPAKPSAGGKIYMLLDGSEGPKMMDNITVSKGRVLIQEDVGNQAHIGKVWSYNIKKDTIELIAEHDPARFTPMVPGFLTQDEESSGIIPLDKILGRGWYLADVQAHYPIPGELVEGGQLLLIHVGKAEKPEGDEDEEEDEE